MQGCRLGAAGKQSLAEGQVPMLPLRLVPDNTSIRFMRGRFAGPLVSAVLSIASLVLFFWPGLNYGIDFRSGIAMKLRLPKGTELASLRQALQRLDLGEVKVQSFGTARDARVSLDQRHPIYMKSI